MREMEKAERPICLIHPVLVHEGAKPLAEMDAHDNR